MKKLKFIIVLFLIIFAQDAYCGHNYQYQKFTLQRGFENNSNFETTELQRNIFGEIPSTQILFNTISETITLFSKKEKSKELIVRLNHSKSKIFSNLVLPQYSFFSRYCSVFMQIFLKTACFRL